MGQKLEIHASYFGIAPKWMLRAKLREISLLSFLLFFPRYRLLAKGLIAQEMHSIRARLAKKTGDKRGIVKKKGLLGLESFHFLPAASAFKPH